MQIGAENRKKVLWASLLGGAALLLLAYQLISSMNAPVTAAQPVPTAGAKPRTRTDRNGKERLVEERLDPTLDLRRLAETEQTRYTGTGRNIFVAQAEEIPKPVAQAQIEDTGPVGPPAPPPPPPGAEFGSSVAL